MIQVHHLGDVPTQLAILKELKQPGRIRYIGVTTTFDWRYGKRVEIMRREPLDFIGIDYAIDPREAEESILPVAQERKVAVLSYQPFGRTRLSESRRQPAGARVCQGVRRHHLGSVLHQVRRQPSSHHGRDTGDQPGEEHDGQPGRRPGRLPDAAMRKRMIERSTHFRGAASR